MDPFDDDDFEDLNETREERLAYNMATTAELLECWSKKADAPYQLAPQRMEKVMTLQALTTAGTSKRPGEANVSTVVKTAHEMGLPANNLPAIWKFDITSDPAANAKDKTNHLRSLDRIITKSSISRTTSDQGPFTSSSELCSIKGKEKETVLQMMSTPPLTEEPMELDALAPPELSPATCKLKLTKTPSKVQSILDNHSNLQQCIEAAKAGKKPKCKKGKGIVSLNKYGDLTRQSNVFQDFVVAVVHHISAKGEQLIPRWLHIHKHGGEVCVRYTPEVTHIACDRDVALSSIYHYLGIEDISEIREGIQIVDWKWFVSSQKAGTLLPVIDTFLHECMKPQATKRRASAPSGLGFTLGKRKSTNDILASVAVGNKKKKYAPTDSDTSQDPDRTASLIHEGSLTAADRWLPPAAGEQADGLDMMISGLQTGAVLETEEDLEEEDAMLEQTGVGAINGTGNTTTTSDGPYKCQNGNSGVKRASINEDIALGLESLGSMYEKAQHKNTFQKQSYKKAANIVRNCPFRIRNEEAATKLKGIGLNIAQRIGEIIRNGGRSDREYFEDNEESRTVAKFGKIYGVGQKAQELWDRGARSLDDLRTGQWGLTEGQKVSISAFAIQISELALTAILLAGRSNRTKIANRHNPATPDSVVHLCGNGEKDIEGLCVEAMGSYRRGEATCGDLDILITRDPSCGKEYKGLLGELIKRLVEKNIVTHTLSAPSNYEADEAKWMGIGRLPKKENTKKDVVKSKYRRIDILMVPWKNYGAIREKKWRGLFKDVIRDANNKKTTEGELVASRTEQEIFDVLNIRYRPPELRRP
ncbi:hypothetical protein QFC21_002574 [Naganishia friedmannii]|uniref:Uncharacterized protein n=1 Tax=Naganishia friedmannii TaxID=89922 RepID=A0ACC2VW83_9TREE|nr:hypothetical protein QFC21_002574 [Naganishia friedmannii]